MMRWLLPLIAASALWAHATRAAEPSLALAFGGGAHGLPHAQVAAAIERELGLHVEQVELEDAALPDLLVVELDAARLRLRYRSARGTIERDLPYEAGAPAALISERIALLAGNLVRDQALAPPALPALESQPAAPLTPEPEAAAPRTPEPQVAEPAPIPAGLHSESARPKPAVPRSERSQVHAFFAVAAFTRVQVDSDIPPADAASNIGLHARFELPISRLLTAGFGASLSHWEGASTRDDGSANLIVSPSDIMDLQFWLRPRLVLGAFELSIPVSFGPSLLEKLEVGDAYPPQLGFAASMQLSALYWVSDGVGIVLELGGEYHHASATEHDGRTLALDLFQPRAALGVGFAL